MIDLILSSIIGGGAIFALYHTWRTGFSIPSGISMGMVAGIALVLMPSKIMQASGIIIYIVGVFAALVYGIFQKELDTRSRLVVSLFSVSILIYWFMRLTHLPGSYIVLLSFLLITAIVSISGKLKLRNELGFLAIMLADVLSIFAEKLLSI